MTERSNTEREAARRYPYGRVPTVADFQQDVFRKVFVAGADWQRTADAEEIAGLTTGQDIWKSAARRERAERDVLDQKIAAAVAFIDDPGNWGAMDGRGELLAAILNVNPPATTVTRRIGRSCAHLHGADVCPRCDYEPTVTPKDDNT